MIDLLLIVRDALTSSLIGNLFLAIGESDGALSFPFLAFSLSRDIPPGGLPLDHRPLPGSMTFRNFVAPVSLRGAVSS